MKKNEEVKRAQGKGHRRSAGLDKYARENLAWLAGVGGGRFLQLGKIFLHLAVINAQEFVGPGGHVDQIGLAFGTFLVHELIDRIILRHGFQQTVHHQE